MTMELLEKFQELIRSRLYTVDICKDCIQGKYASNVGLSACTDCSPGKYSRAVDAVSGDVCTLCPAGSFSLLPGSSD